MSQQTNKGKCKCNNLENGDVIINDKDGCCVVCGRKNGTFIEINPTLKPNLSNFIEKREKITSGDVVNLLSKEYPLPDCAFIAEFRSGTGWGREQRADAIAMHCWPSKGLELIGFEIKISRSDWLHELRQPNKADHVKQFCDKWYLVVSDLKIIKYIEELPKGWGLMFMEDGKLLTMIEAEKLQPQPIDRLFLAALMRRATKNLVLNEVLKDNK